MIKDAENRAFSFRRNLLAPSRWELDFPSIVCIPLAPGYRRGWIVLLGEHWQSLFGFHGLDCALPHRSALKSMPILIYGSGFNCGRCDCRACLFHGTILATRINMREHHRHPCTEFTGPAIQ